MTLATKTLDGVKPCCPACSEPVFAKVGVRFAPQSARILNMIEDVTKGRGGIERESLAPVFFPGVPKKVAMRRVKSHVCQINSMLLSTNWRIVNARLNSSGHNDGAL